MEPTTPDQVNDNEIEATEDGAQETAEDTKSEADGSDSSEGADAPANPETNADGSDVEPSVNSDQPGSDDTGSEVSEDSESSPSDQPAEDSAPVEGDVDGVDPGEPDLELKQAKEEADPNRAPEGEMVKVSVTLECELQKASFGDTRGDIRDVLLNHAKNQWRDQVGSLGTEQVWFENC